MQRAYDAILFRQRPKSPLQVTFAAPSSEIDLWARVPTKKTGNIRNFQRAEIPRHVKEVERFFTDEANASPTAVVVGFDPIRANGRVETLTRDDQPLLESSILAGVPHLGKIRITWDDSDEPATRTDFLAAIDALKPELQKFIYEDLRDITSLSPTKFNELHDYITNLARAGGELDTPNAQEESGEPEETETDLPEEFRSKLSGLSPSEQQIVAGRLWFLAQTDPQVLTKKLDDYIRTLYWQIRDELKPGLLIDGQHRVNGTKKLANIPFLVTALPSAAWPELAFQFIVTNRTARRVPESLLISIVGNSLSKKQRADIEERLRDANIRVGLIEAVMRVQEDELSPFYGYISFGIKAEKGFLDAAAFRNKVIQLWYERQGPVQELFDHLCQGKKKTEKTEYWKDEELWFQYFVAFWSAVRERYEGTTVFSDEIVGDRPASPLMTATVLGIFQDTVLTFLAGLVRDKLNAEGTPIAASLPDETALGDRVKKSLGLLTPDFFTGWQITGFDGSRGAREDLADAITKVLKGHLSVAKLKAAEHRLYKGEAKKNKA